MSLKHKPSFPKCTVKTPEGRQNTHCGTCSTVDLENNDLLSWKESVLRQWQTIREISKGLGKRELQAGQTDLPVWPSFLPTFLASTRAETIWPLSFSESITYLIDAIEKLCGLQRLTVKQLETEVTDCHNHWGADSGTEAKAAMLHLENTRTASEQGTYAWRTGKRWLGEALGRVSSYSEGKGDKTLAPCLTTMWPVWQSTRIWGGKDPKWLSDPRRQNWAECGLGMSSAQMAVLWSLAPSVYISWMWFVNKGCHRLCLAEAKVILAWGLAWVRSQQRTWRPPRLARLSENLNQRAAGQKWVWEKAQSPSK